LRSGRSPTLQTTPNAPEIFRQCGSITFQKTIRHSLLTTRYSLPFPSKFVAYFDATGEDLVERQPTFSIATLGCKVNQYDSWQLARQLKEMGFRQVPFGAPADVVIVNSCTVTHVAEAKSRKMLSRARRASLKGIVVFTGCTA
jgi:hypothetical protein